MSYSFSNAGLPFSKPVLHNHFKFKYRWYNTHRTAQFPLIRGLYVQHTIYGMPLNPKKF
ncbi:hypothetical protein HYPBUDRAFT_153441 [Hyphopichia burtonii NRRL Y-1933]|uniref:Uncharacterized protein n=1 Tax=Hyphopichia burtonii NRRL Y-1933 TaxID=984485 RepID=A0A1E4RHL0_9ASCO|nr:hypothetical protein HYPBUDRAFT_153441 [Hyphopichia burtonii NRRL Y-1933]ODV66749.1 hypothetical protein HYPBUDRAFT_153441 [Hyphopichia burtonii NRRL Y-1933]